MSYELIITEKPNAAKKIAQALADGSAKKKSSKQKVPYYELTHKGKKIVIVSAVGHIYGLTQKGEQSKSKYPLFEIGWVPISKTSKSASYTKKYLSTIKKLARDASEFTVATDYDVEGEVIGLNVVRYACKQKDAARMKFSTLTKSDLVNAYENKSPQLNWGQAHAGVTRHKLDWYFGINLSRALTAAVKATGRFKLMSTGRVQGPALKLVVDKEKEIQEFVPTPYWELYLDGTLDKVDITAQHVAGKIEDKKQATDIFAKVKDTKQAQVTAVESRKQRVKPPTPFDLTSMQIEAHGVLRMKPKQTLSTAQELYSNGYISYPRTSSQQYPESIGVKKILKALQKQKQYAKHSKFVLEKTAVKPNNGKKTDPAHPAIYPTGTVPKFKNAYEKKLYDLIVHRFLAVFGKPAIRASMKVHLDCNKEDFIAKGIRTIEEGWFALYQPYVRVKEEPLPPVKKSDICQVKKIDLEEKETQPPRRYTDASIIRALEKESLGTKSTRAQIVETLKDRGYITQNPLKATDLGIRTEGTLEKYAPKIVEPELTRNFEQKMQKIRDGKVKPDAVLEDSQKAIQDLIKHFNNHLKTIGKALYEAHRETEDKRSFIAKCPVCKEGNLHIRKGKYGRFVACNKYPDCKTTFNVPRKGVLKKTEKICETCGHPIVLVGKRKTEYCLNPDCKSKSINNKTTYEEEGMLCPVCKKGKMVLRTSYYGDFLGCDNYPKCKTMMKIIDGKVDTKPITKNAQ